MKRYRLIGDKMVERPNKGEWVRWEDVKDIPDSIILATVTKTEVAEDAPNSDNKRNRK